jgi:hypothetical protein
MFIYFIEKFKNNSCFMPSCFQMIYWMSFSRWLSAFTIPCFRTSLYISHRQPLCDATVDAIDCHDGHSGTGNIYLWAGGYSLHVGCVVSPWHASASSPAAARAPRGRRASLSDSASRWRRATRRPCCNWSCRPSTSSSATTTRWSTSRAA